MGQARPLAFILGPCVIESETHTLKMAEALTAICDRIKVKLIFKASFDKANRSSIHSFRGPGLTEGLRILAKVRQTFGIPILTDIHEAAQAAPAAESVDVLQIPAFLCRQTDLLAAAAATGRCVNVKKGQFMSPEEMENVAAKLREGGCDNFMLTERGTFFGYSRLVNDMTAIPNMRRLAPVVFDATHSCQLPGAAGNASGGRPEFAPILAAAAVAAGADAVFMETHDNPAAAKSDAATVLPLNRMEAILSSLTQIAGVVRQGLC